MLVAQVGEGFGPGGGPVIGEVRPAQVAGVVVAGGEEAAQIVVGQNVPFVTGSILTNSASATPYTTIERKDVGITLRVLPRINAGDTIRLEVSQEASSIATTGAALTGCSP